MNIDKTRRNRQTACVDDFFVRFCDEFADVGDLIADYPHVPGEGLASAAVDYYCPNDDPGFRARRKLAQSRAVRLQDQKRKSSTKR